MSPKSSPNWVARAEDLRADIELLADRAEEGRTLPPETVQLLRDADLFTIAAPEAVGGAELDPVVQTQVYEALCAADGSTGWCLLIGLVVIVLGVTIPLGLRIAQIKHQIALIESCGGTVEMLSTGPEWVEEYVSDDIGLLFAEIEVVNLFNEPVPDHVLKVTGRFHDLKVLELGRCEITDTGLKEVAKLENLKEVWLHGARITYVGRTQLQKALPKCKITHNAKK